MSKLVCSLKLPRNAVIAEANDSPAIYQNVNCVNFVHIRPTATTYHKQDLNSSGVNEEESEEDEEGAEDAEIEGDEDSEDVQPAQPIQPLLPAQSIQPVQPIQSLQRVHKSIPTQHRKRKRTRKVDFHDFTPPTDDTEDGNYGDVSRLNDTVAGVPDRVADNSNATAGTSASGSLVNDTTAMTDVTAASDISTQNTVDTLNNTAQRSVSPRKGAYWKDVGLEHLHCEEGREYLETWRSFEGKKPLDESQINNDGMLYAIKPGYLVFGRLSVQQKCYLSFDRDCLLFDRHLVGKDRANGFGISGFRMFPMSSFLEIRISHQNGFALFAAKVKMDSAYVAFANARSTIGPNGYEPFTGQSDDILFKFTYGTEASVQLLVQRLRASAERFNVSMEPATAHDNNKLNRKVEAKKLKRKQSLVNNT